jgi:hypothetical protein
MVLGLAPFGSLQAGWVAEHFGVRIAFSMGGLVCLAVAAGVAWWMGRGVRAVRERRERRQGPEPERRERREGREGVI